MTDEISKKLEQIIALAQECLGEAESAVAPHASGVYREVQVKPENIALDITNKVGDCDESDRIQDRILDSGEPGIKILLCLYISYKYFDNTWLTSGDVERITSQLAVKISTSNASTRLKKKLRPYVESGETRKNGQPTPYRINRKGVKYFEETLSGNSSKSR